MPLQRAKLHDKTGKLKVLKQSSKSVTEMNVNSSNSPTSLSSSAARIEGGSNLNQDSLGIEQQFLIELYWCVQQLENSLHSGKLNQKQAQDSEKALKILKSSNQPIIKKRQLMRSTFGDYRAKMTEEEKKMSLSSRNIKFTNSGLNAKGKKSYCIKKSALLVSDGINFKFNFPIEEQVAQLNINSSQQEVGKKQQESSQQSQQNSDKIQKNNKDELVKIQDGEDKDKHENNIINTTAPNSYIVSNLKFVPSANTFRFNFSIDTDETT